MNYFTKESILEAVRTHKISVRAANLMLHQLKQAEVTKQNVIRSRSSQAA